MPNKYPNKRPNTNFAKYVDLSANEIWRLIRDESVELERTDLKNIIAELCIRIMNAKAIAG